MGHKYKDPVARKAYQKQWKIDNKDKVINHSRSVVSRLSDSYVITKISRFLKIDRNSEIITPELIQAYRLNILIKRKIK